MKLARISCLVIIGSALVTCKNPVFNLDHFLAYRATNVGGGSVPSSVSLDDQFLPDTVSFGNPEGPLLYFCNPVDKNGEGIKDKNAHLSWYVMTDNLRHRFDITYSNQMTGFKKKKLRITKMAFILLPTEKIEPGSCFPVNLDHYVGYVVDPIPRESKTVSLADQFLSTTGTATELLFFCAPASKNFSVIKNSEDHLAVYRISTNAMPDRNVRINNQFGPQDFVPERIYYLLVPTKKHRVRPYL